MPYIGEPYNQEYFHTFSDPARPEGYHDYNRFLDFAQGQNLWVNIANDIEAFTGPVTGKSVLDVGCAYGHLTSILHERGANIIGIDISAWAISQAIALYPPHAGLSFVQGDMVTNSFSNNQFNLSVICGALECMPDDPTIATFLNQLNRVTRNNGNMYFLVDYNRGPTPIYQNRTPAEWLAALQAGIPGPFTFDVQDVGHLPLYYATRVVVS